ncbi:hypothetical protein JCM6882_007929 [Rhodosporidiobolus microsporus]
MPPAEKRRRLSVSQSNGAHNLPSPLPSTSASSRPSSSGGAGSGGGGAGNARSAAGGPPASLALAALGGRSPHTHPLAAPYSPPVSPAPYGGPGGIGGGAGGGGGYFDPPAPGAGAASGWTANYSMATPSNGSGGGGGGGSFGHGGPGTNTFTASSSDAFSAGRQGQGQAGAPRPRLQSQHSNETVSSVAGGERGLGPGDELRIEGYREVQVLSVHYDDIVACRAISTTRGDQRVALKLSLSAKPTAAQQFKAEAALLAKLRDAGVGNISKVLARESGRYGAMMVIQNEDLKLWAETYQLRNRPPAPYWTDGPSLIRAIDNAIRLVRLAAQIHKAGIVHNSIRPTTVSNSVFNEVHLHDFSCAFHLPTAAAHDAADTAPIRERGMREESLPYLAPECSGRVGKTADRLADYYSIGATLFEVFTGQVPFADALDPLEIVHAHIAKRPPLMSQVDPSVPHGLSLVVAKLLEKSPEARYQTSQGLIVDLERVRDLIPTATTPGPFDARRSSVTVGAAADPSSPLGRSVSPFTSASTTAGTVGTFQLGAVGLDDFVVGSLDEAAYFRLPPASQLFGRDKSIEQLAASFERVKQSNKPAVVVVKGHSGIGKTSLIETLRGPAVASRGHFTSVKFDQIKSPVPFFAITQALSGLFRHLLSEPETSLSVWRRRLSRALGKEARVLADVLPSLEHVFEHGWLDEQPAVPVLSAQESEERFQGLVQKVLRTFARVGKPLAVVFDDLQWSTLPDLAFIRSLSLLGSDEDEDPLTCKMANPMLLVCLWRDNEVGPDHIVETDLVPKLAHIDLSLTLEPLTLADVSGFVSTALRNPTTPRGGPGIPPPADRVDANVRRLSELILEKTRGSPLFVAQLLNAFNREGCFTFDFTRGQWQYDLDLIASKSVSTNVVELLQAQMQKYSVLAQEALKVAACLGNEELQATTLATAAGRTVEELSRDLHEAVMEGLLVPRGEIKLEEEDELDEVLNGTAPLPRALEMPLPLPSTSNREDPPSPRKDRSRVNSLRRPSLLSRRKVSIVTKPPVPASYTFFHDRCQQAAYALIPTTGRSALHYLVGQRLIAAHKSNEHDLREHIFDLVQQLNHGIDILSTIEQRDELARYNFVAGEKAAGSTAFEAARNYLQIAWDALGAGGWTGQYDLMSDVVEALVKVEYSLTDYQAAQEYVRVFLAHSKDPVAKLRVVAVSIRCATAVGDSNKAIDIGREGLASVGLRFPETTEEAETLVEGIRKKLALSLEGIEALSNAPPIADRVAAGCQAILAALVPPIYFCRIDLLGGLSSLSLELVCKHGIDDAGSFVLTLHAVLVRSKYKAAKEALAYGKAAIAYFEKHGGSPLACPTYKVYSSHVGVWASTPSTSSDGSNAGSTSIRDVLPTFREAVAFGIEFRDAEYVGFGCGELCSYSLLAGAPLGEIGSNVERYAVLVRKFRNELSTTYIGLVQQAVLSLAGRASEPREIDGEAFSIADYHNCREKNYSLTLLEYHMLRLLIAVCFRDIERAKESIPLGREHLAGGQGLLYPVFFRLFEAVTLYDIFPTISTEEHDILKETHVEIEELAASQADSFNTLKLWLDAERVRATGDVAEALKAYDIAIEEASNRRYLHFAACMNERAAACLPSLKLATGYLSEAHALWLAWGCAPKVQRMEADFPTIFPPRPHPVVTPSVPTGTPPVHHSHLADYVSTSTGSAESATEPSVRDDSQTTPVWVDTPNLSQPERRPSDGSHESHSHHSEPHDVEMLSNSRSVDHSDVHARSQLATELDLRTVVTASSVISGELSVDGVVSKLLNLALRTAGGEMCLLVLDKSGTGTFCAEAIARSDSNEVQHLRRTDTIDTTPEKYPCSVINYVARSREMVVNTFDDAIPDPYMRHRRPKSILCLALASQQRVIGVLFMENSQTTQAFTPDRLEILSLISGQAASTIEKARLVQDLKNTNQDLKRSQAALEASNRTLESRIAERTLELRHNNSLLQAEVAEKERAQAEMRQAKEIAESATAMKSQFLANMSHEIRTPFNAVVALSSLLLDTQLTPLQTDYVETIKNSSQELLVVINDILDYSKIELDHLELSSESVQLRAVLESSMDMVAERAATKSIELALIIEEGDIFILGDLTRLRQIVVNLLSNAVKFTSEGEITVTASSKPAEPDSEGRARRRCKLSVKDTGIGIAKENFGRLFRVFSQAEGAETSRNFGGTGLGLAISRKLSRLMDGDLTVDSELGKGSTFTVEWLALAGEPPEKDPFSPRSNRDLIGKRVLVVDANTTSRTVLTQLVTSFGLQVEAPEDVTEAYNIAVSAFEKHKQHDLVVIDAFLPSFGAQVLLRRLRQKGISAPAIALTRMGSPIYEEMRQLDCKFLIKPIKRNRLHHTLRLVFPAGESPRPSSPAPASPAFPSNLATRNPLSILCAEDNPINVKVITHLLKRMGYLTDIAEDGAIAVEKAQKKRYDLILMDLNMPNMGGLEATRKIHEIMPDPTQRPSIVCLTANAMAEDKIRCIEAGADGYVSKPILVPELVNALNEAGARRTAVLNSTGGVPPPPPSASGSFELELPTTRLGRGSRKNSNSSRSSRGTRSGPSSPSPEPPSSGSTAGALAPTNGGAGTLPLSSPGLGPAGPSPATPGSAESTSST